MKAWQVSLEGYGIVFVHALTSSKARYKVFRSASEYIRMTLMDFKVIRAPQFDNLPIRPHSSYCRCEICNGRIEVQP